MKNQPKQLLIAGGMAFGVASLGMAGSASAAIFFTPAQTLTFGPAAPAWTHTFSFDPFIAPDLTATFNSVHITVTGTQDTGAGNIVCVGASSTPAPCVGTFMQTSTFTVVSAPAFPATPSFGPLSVVMEDTFNIPAPPPFGNSFQDYPETTTTNSLTYANSVTASGGSLVAGNFTSTSPIDLIFQARSASGVESGATGIVAPNFPVPNDTLTVSLSYDYIDIPEPAGLIPLSAASLALLVACRRRRWPVQLTGTEK